MSDTKSVLLGTIVGGAITIAGGWMQANTTRQHQVMTEKMAKLEQIMESAIKTNKCIKQMLDVSADKNYCDEESPDNRLLALTELYFPELRKEVSAYLTKVNNARLQLAKCPQSSSDNEKSILRIECLQKSLEYTNFGNELQNLSNKAAEISKGLM